MHKLSSLYGYNRLPPYDVTCFIQNYILCNLECYILKLCVIETIWINKKKSQKIVIFKHFEKKQRITTDQA